MSRNADSITETPEKELPRSKDSAVSMLDLVPMPSLTGTRNSGGDEYQVAAAGLNTYKKKTDEPVKEQPAQTVTAPEAKAKVGQTKTVYLDIGHCTSNEGKGGNDRGFQGPGFDECSLNTSLGLELERQLKARGAYVVKTWDPANPPNPVPKQQDLQRRIDAVNTDVAKYKDDSIYVSIHHDADGKRESGQCVFVAEPRRNESMKLAQTIQDSAWKVRNGDCIRPDTMTQNKQLKGLRGVESIGVLLEVANVKNPGDASVMNTRAFQTRVATDITNGIANYFKLKPGVERPEPYAHMRMRNR